VGSLAPFIRASTCLRSVRVLGFRFGSLRAVCVTDMDVRLNVIISSRDVGPS
jgi:hypothetical protein